MNKQCRICHELKPLFEFNKHSHKKGREMKIDLIKKSKELWLIFRDTKTGSLYDDNLRWLEVARYVHAEILKARIDESNIHLGLKIQESRDRIDALKAEIEVITAKRKDEE